MKRYFGHVLSAYCDKQRLPMHMPGHKRKGCFANVGTADEDSGCASLGLYAALNAAMAYDVTELPGLDDLHHPEGALRQSLEALREVYGSAASYYLVNGSTVGILTAVGAVCDAGDTILLAEHCHMSAYHAAELYRLQTVVLPVKEHENPRIPESVSADEVRKSLEDHPEIRAVVLPSPTYEGVISDVESIAEVVHKAGAVLIVDGAHGAHLPFLYGQSALKQGADIVVESLHKTLPCPTQCAILHLREETYKESIRHQLSILESSSPSYLLVAAMENAVATMEEMRDTRIPAYLEDLRSFRERCKSLKNLRLFSPRAEESSPEMQGIYDYDETKLLISGDGISPAELLRRLTEAGVVPEMHGLDAVLLMSTVADTKEDFKFLWEVLFKLDDELEKENKASWDSTNHCEGSVGDDVRKYSHGIEQEDAAVLTHEEVPDAEKSRYKARLMAACGKRAATDVIPYPPGVPILQRGEEITKEKIEKLLPYLAAGVPVHGGEDGYIKTMET